MLFERLARWMARPKAGDDLGSRGEHLVARDLRRRGYKILEINWWCRRGEVDVICRTPDRRVLVFVEVKTRRNTDVDPEIQVNQRKRRQVAGAAKVFCRRFGDDLPPCRFDIAAVVWAEDETPVIRYHENAFAPMDMY